MIELNHLSFSYGKEKIIDDVSCRLENAQVTALIGPNGAGKTTFLRLMARMLRPQSGKILVDGREAAAYEAKAFARQLAYLPQSRPVPEITVRALVGLGRFAHGRGDREAVERAVCRAGLEKLAGRDVRTLSGGQRQMAYLAMLLAQESPNVLLDEPLTHLDAGSQLDVAALIRCMKEEGKCVAVVLHDLGMLDRVCDRALLLHNGRAAFDGSAAECLHSPALEEAFGVRAVDNAAVRFERR